MRKALKKAVYPLIAVIIIAADQITKYMVRANLKLGEAIPVIGNWMRICYVQNTGTAFSMFEGNRFITVFLTSALIIGCVVYAISEIRAGRRLVPLLLCCIASGGISNMIDRLSLGFVTDMISCGQFAVFNVADMFISTCCVLLMLMVLISYKKESDEKKASEKGGSDE